MLTPAERLEEALFTGLRLVEGVDIDGMSARYGIDVWVRYGEALEPYLVAGLARRDGSRLRLTREGMLTSNEILAVFV